MTFRMGIGASSHPCFIQNLPWTYWSCIIQSPSRGVSRWRDLSVKNLKSMSAEMRGERKVYCRGWFRCAELRTLNETATWVAPSNGRKGDFCVFLWNYVATLINISTAVKSQLSADSTSNNCRWCNRFKLAITGPLAPRLETGKSIWIDIHRWYFQENAIVLWGNTQTM